MIEHLLEKAELLMEIEGYEQDCVKKSDNAIDIKASKPDSDDMVMMYIIPMNTIDIDQAKAYETIRLKFFRMYLLWRFYLYIKHFCENLSDFLSILVMI